MPSVVVPVPPMVIMMGPWNPTCTVLVPLTALTGIFNIPVAPLAPASGATVTTVDLVTGGILRHHQREHVLCLIEGVVRCGHRDIERGPQRGCHRVVIVGVEALIPSRSLVATVNG